MSGKPRVSVLFLGNICRSPTAEGVFRHLLQREGMDEYIEVDSAGTHAYHIGEPPDARAQETAATRGIDLSGLRGRRAVAHDLEVFDYVLAMDRENYDNLLAMSPKGHVHKVQLFMSYAADRLEDEVPDPYYGGDSGFDRVLDMIEEAAAGLLQDIRQRQGF